MGNKIRKQTYIMLLFLLFILNSCCSIFFDNTSEYEKSKKEFKKEIEFVNKILENPERIKEIIETSKFYEKDLLDLENSNQPYEPFLSYFKTYKNPSIRYFDTHFLMTHKSGKIFVQSKFIHVKSDGANYSIQFVFKKIGRKNLLLSLKRVK